MGQAVEVDYDEPDLMMTLLPGGTAADYDGLDRFGRDNLPRCNYGSSTDAARIGPRLRRGRNRVCEDTLSNRPRRASISTSITTMTAWIN